MTSIIDYIRRYVDVNMCEGDEEERDRDKGLPCCKMLSTSSYINAHAPTCTNYNHATITTFTARLAREKALRGSRPNCHTLFERTTTTTTTILRFYRPPSLLQVKDAEARPASLLLESSAFAIGRVPACLAPSVACVCLSASTRARR